MKKSGFIALLIPILTSWIFANAEEAPSPEEQYRQERLGKRAYERFLYAQEMLALDQDATVLDEAVQDVVRYAANRDEDDQALRAIEAAIPKLPPDGSLVKPYIVEL